MFLQVENHATIRRGVARYLPAAVTLVILLLAMPALAQKAPQATVAVSAPALIKGAGTTFTVPILLSDPSGAGVGSFQFYIVFDPAVITPVGSNFGCSATGQLAANMPPLCNVEAGVPNTILVAAAGNSPTSGSGTLFNMTFKATLNGPYPRSSGLHFTDVFFYTLNAPLTTQVTDGSVLVSAPTAANVSVSGRVLSSVGAGVRAARVTFTDENGVIRVAITNSFGRYSFGDLPSGHTYVAAASSRSLTFTPRPVVVNDTLSDVDIIPD